MKRKILKNKPLIEAIFELRWRHKINNLEETDTPPYKKDQKMRINPHYKLLVGRLYDKLIDEYPYHEELPASDIPVEFVGYIVQHRFRKDEKEWPLIQLGPGILTVNDTKGYTWEDFEKRVEKAVETLFALYPKSGEDLIIERLMLRYIDSVDFNYENDNIFEFLKEKMKTQIILYEKLFEATNVELLPSNFDLRFDFKTHDPKGTVFLRFVRGKSNIRKTDILLWETVVRSTSEEVPKRQSGIANWIKKAHNLTDDWFFKLIEGDLEKRFE